MSEADGAGERPAPSGRAEASVTAPGAARLWVWEAMDPQEQTARLEELGEWVDWLVRTFALESQLGTCWFLHPDVVEHLTALYLGWVRTYSLPAEGKTPERIGELDWLARFHVMTPHLTTRTCGRGHEERVAVPWKYSPRLMRMALDADRQRRAQGGAVRAPRNPAAYEMARYQHSVSAASAAQRAGQSGPQPSQRAKRARSGAAEPSPARQATTPDQDPAAMARSHEEIIRGFGAVDGP